VRPWSSTIFCDDKTTGNSRADSAASTRDFRAGVPEAVVKEFDERLDAYIRQYTRALLAHFRKQDD